MQSETLKNVAQSNPRNYLRVATLSSKTSLCYLYIGTETNHIQFLRENFSRGFAVDNFELAKKFFAESEAKNVDVIIIDINYNENEIKAFHSFLNNRSLNCIPTIYDASHFKDKDAIKYHELIDDIIDLQNWQFDFYTKVAFLRKSKENNHAVQENRKNAPLTKRYVLKRGLDIISSSLLIVLLLPVFIVIAFAIKLESRGPVFYTL
jgi:hypothetical protein